MTFKGHVEKHLVPYIVGAVILASAPIIRDTYINKRDNSLFRKTADVSYYDQSMTHDTYVFGFDTDKDGIIDIIEKRGNMITPGGRARMSIPTSSTFHRGEVSFEFERKKLLTQIDKHQSSK